MHHGPLAIESTVWKAGSTILGTLGILNFRHLLNAAIRSIAYMAIFMHTFVRGARFIAVAVSARVEFPLDKRGTRPW